MSCPSVDRRDAGERAPSPCRLAPNRANCTLDRPSPPRLGGYPRNPRGAAPSRVGGNRDREGGWPLGFGSRVGCACARDRIGSGGSVGAVATIVVDNLGGQMERACFSTMRPLVGPGRPSRERDSLSHVLTLPRNRR